MAIHDAFARLTPYELSFPDLAFARAHFDAIREEAEARGTDLGDPTAFVLLAAAGQALQEIRGTDDDPALIRQYGALLYHAFHFHAAGEPLVLVRAAALRPLLDGHGGREGWVPALDPPAGYAQLPQHLVWVRALEGDPPESLDGFFWTRASEGRFGLLLALGMRGERPGVSVVPLDDLPVEDADGWTRMQMREGGEDFASSLPGSELEGLYELQSAGEALKLAARVLAALDGAGMSTRVPPDPDAHGARPSALSYRILDAP